MVVLTKFQLLASNSSRFAIPKGKRARQLFVLQGLPGLGPGRAARLLDHFGSIQAVMTASATDLTAVEGIGETTAARIRWVLD